MGNKSNGLKNKNIYIIFLGLLFTLINYFEMLYWKVRGNGVYYVGILLGIIFIIIGLYQTLNKRLN